MTLGATDVTRHRTIKTPLSLLMIALAALPLGACSDDGGSLTTPLGSLPAGGWRIAFGVNNDRVIRDLSVAGRYAYAACDDYILRFDGTAWEPSSDRLSDHAAAIHAAGESDVVACGRDMVWQYDGSAWQATMVGHLADDVDLDAIWGTSPDEVFAGGEHGLVIRCDGTDWSSLPLPSPVRITDIWGTSPTNVYAVADGEPALHRFDGQTWSAIDHGQASLRTLESVWGTGPDDVWVGGPDIVLHFDGTQWRDTGFTAGNRGGGPSSEVRDVRRIDGVPHALTHDAVYRHDGGGWTSVGTSPESSLREIADLPSGPVAFGRTVALVPRGSDWEILYGDRGGLNGVWGTSASNLYTISRGRIDQLSGSGWARVGDPGEVRLNGIWGSGPSDITAVGADHTILHYDGATWTTVNQEPRTDSLNDIAGDPSGLVVAVGDNRIMEFDGAWRTVPVAATLYAVWTDGEGEWLAGGQNNNDEGVLVRRTGSTWEELPITFPEQVNGLWGTGPDDVFVLTRDDVFHFGGTDWMDMNTPYSEFWADMVGRSATDVYAVGNEGTVMRYDGVRWALMDVPTVCDLDGLAVIDGAVYATGGNGVPIMLILD